MLRKAKIKLEIRLDNQSDVKISESHLKETRKMVQNEFSYTTKRERIRFNSFLIRQIRFVSYPIWLLQGVSLVLALSLLHYFQDDTITDIWYRNLPVIVCICSIIFAATGIPSIGRSIKYNMLEVEIGTHFSQPFLLLARILIVFIGDIVSFTFIFYLLRWGSSLSIISCLVYLLLPFLIASCGCTFIQSKMQGQSGEILAGVFCSIFVVVLFVINKINPIVYLMVANLGGILACGIFTVLLLFLIHQLLIHSSSLDRAIIS